MSTQAVAALPSRKPDIDRRLDEISSSVRVKLRETGARVVAVGLELAEAKRLLGPGRAFESWVVSACGLSVATAYRWIQAAEGFRTLRLDQRPDLLDETDVADMLSVSFPQSLRTRIQARVKALDAAEEQAKEAKAEAEREARKLVRLEAELAEAEAELKKAEEKADRIEAKAKEAKAEVLNPAKEKADGVRSKVRDIKERLDVAQAKVHEITKAARERVTEAKAQTQAAKQAVTQAQAKVTEAEAKVTEAKAEVQTEVKAAIAKNGKGKAEATTKGQAWETFLKGWLNTLEEKVKTMIPIERQWEALQAVGNMVLALSQAYKAKAKAA